MSDQREMTLDEYLKDKLPDFHLARRQLQSIRDERDALSAENAALDQERSRLRLEVMKLAAHMERIQAAREQSKSDDPFTAMSGFSALDSAIKNAPATSLAQRDAEAAKKHFLYGYHFCRENGFLFHEQLEEAGEEYARRVAEED